MKPDKRTIGVRQTACIFGFVALWWSLNAPAVVRAIRLGFAVFALLRSRVLWISVGVSLACHASLMVALRLSYLRAKEQPSYVHLPVRVLMVEGEDVSVTQTARDAFSIPAPPSSPDTSLNDEKAEKQAKPKPKPPKEKKTRKKTAKRNEPPKKAEPKPAPPTKTEKKKERKAQRSSTPTPGGAARRPVPVGMQGKEKRSLRLDLNPPVRMPRRAWNEGRFGTTWVRVFVSATGSAERVEIAQSSGHADLDAVALRHVRTKFRFSPAVVDGKAVAARCQVYVEFPRPR